MPKAKNPQIITLRRFQKSLLQHKFPKQPPVRVKKLLFRNLNPEIPPKIKNRIERFYFKRKKNNYVKHKSPGFLIELTNIMWENSQTKKPKTRKEISKEILHKKGILVKETFISDFIKEVGLSDTRPREKRSREIIAEYAKKELNEENKLPQLALIEDMLHKLALVDSQITRGRAKEIYREELIRVRIEKAREIKTEKTRRGTVTV